MSTKRKSLPNKVDIEHNRSHRKQGCNTNFVRKRHHHLSKSNPNFSVLRAADVSPIISIHEVDNIKDCVIMVSGSNCDKTYMNMDMDLDSRSSTSRDSSSSDLDMKNSTNEIFVLNKTSSSLEESNNRNLLVMSKENIGNKRRKKSNAAIRNQENRLKAAENTDVTWDTDQKTDTKWIKLEDELKCCDIEVVSEHQELFTNPNLLKNVSDSSGNFDPIPINLDAGLLSLYGSPTNVTEYTTVQQSGYLQREPCKPSSSGENQTHAKEYIDLQMIKQLHLIRSRLLGQGKREPSFSILSAEAEAGDDEYAPFSLSPDSGSGTLSLTQIIGLESHANVMFIYQKYSR